MAGTTKHGNDLGLAGRGYWVVGAGGGGIGTAVCLALSAAGAQVWAVDREAQALRATTDAAAGLAGSVEPIVLDATNRPAVEAAVDERHGDGDTVDGLVNVVGGLLRDEFGRTESVDDAVFDAVLTRNLRPAWLFSQVFARKAMERSERASIVQLASIAALQGMPFGAPYAMAKAALISLARTQALEWGPKGVRVNTVAAGTVRTPRSTASDVALDRRVLPLGRRGEPRDIAGAVLFLLSDLADWVTGQVLAVDGGASIKPSYLDDDGLAVFVQDDAIRARITRGDDDGDGEA